ncbi:MAG: hypothetical protein ACTSQS_18255 [Promethearchaeota archaeon]
MCKAIIIYLSRKKDLRDLKRSIKRLHKYFNSKFNYPILIFHDDLDIEDQKDLKHLDSNIQFEQISFKIPEWINKNKITFDKWGIGYRNICRFYSGEFFKHEALEEYDWYWRLDSDSFFHSQINYDIFKFMKINKYLYGYLGKTLKDKPTVVEGLWELTKK